MRLLHLFNIQNVALKVAQPNRAMLCPSTAMRTNGRRGKCTISFAVAPNVTRLTCALLNMNTSSFCFQTHKILAAALFVVRIHFHMNGVDTCELSAL